MKRTHSEKTTSRENTLNTVIEGANAPNRPWIKILLATLLALVVAIFILLAFVLPAEFNKDPLGVGQRLGIKGLSGQPENKMLTMEARQYHDDTVSFELLPFEFVEYKYQLNQGSAMLYNWVASDTVTFDFHGEPEGGPEGFAESFSLGAGADERGTFTAPFSGIHGWFWENRSSNTVTVTLNTAGFYTESLTFRDGFVTKIAFEAE